MELLHQMTHLFNQAASWFFATYTTAAYYGPLLLFGLTLFLFVNTSIKVWKDQKNPTKASKVESTVTFHGRELDLRPTRTPITEPNHRQYFVDSSTVKLEDVIGIDPIRDEIEDIVETLEYFSALKELTLGFKPPKGLLLTGRPGVGKTLIAKAISNEAKMPIFVASGSEFGERYVGVGASRIRELFTQARRNAPALIFIDEIDTIGSDRANSNSADAGQTLNQLLTEMDGFQVGDNVFVIAATNLADVLDPALTRPGRFDRIVEIPLPNRAGRLELLRYFVNRLVESNMANLSNLDLESLAARSAGFSGAELEEVVRSAFVKVGRRGEMLTQVELETALVQQVAGIALADRLTSQDEVDTERVAFHEAGHAIAEHFLSEGSRIVDCVSIVPRSSGSLGFTWAYDRRESVFQTPETVNRELAVLLAGRAAEIHFFGEPSSSAYDDLRRARALAKKAVNEMGLSRDRDGNWQVGVFCEDSSNLTQLATQLIADSAQRVQQLMGDRAQQTTQVARLLLEHKTLNRTLFESTLEG